MKREYFSGVTTRFLRKDERYIHTKEDQLPLVIEPSCAESKDVRGLKTFLSSHSDQILDDVAKYGAVLLRGFDVSSTQEFQDIILSIQGMQGMGHLFMSEPGRTHVDGLDYVFHTNSMVKTGGTLQLGGFHNENYYSPDVPNYISFCCFSPAEYGGETGLINMQRVYEKLDSSLQKKLEKNTFFVSKWPVATIASRYNVDATAVRNACVDFGLHLNDEDQVVMYKPSVLVCSKTGKKIIQANLCAELYKLNDEILNQFVRDYKGWKWLIHKATWIFLGYRRLRQLSFMLPSFFRHPIRFLKMYPKMKQKIRQYTDNKHLRIESVFTDTDVSILAGLMRECFSSFLWKKGDVLLVDNVHVAHAGMPGRTSKANPREIRAMLCNPLKLSYSSLAPGLWHNEEFLPETLGEILHKMSLKKSGVMHVKFDEKSVSV